MQYIKPDAQYCEFIPDPFIELLNINISSSDYALRRVALRKEKFRPETSYRSFRHTVGTVPESPLCFLVELRFSLFNCDTFQNEVF